jgi:hypothetical protein
MATETVTIDFNATFFPLGLNSVASFGNAAAFSEEADLLHAAPKRPIDDDDADLDDDEEEDDDDLEDEEDEDEDEEEEDDDLEDDDDDEDEDEDDEDEDEDEDVDELRVSSRR